MGAENPDFDPSKFKTLDELKEAFPEEVQNYQPTEDGKGFVLKSVSIEPTRAERQNLRNEAADTNRMVDEELISRQEASKFNYEDEIEIPQTLLSTAPKVTERMRQHIIAKFPPESFEPENIAETGIHGTSIHAIRPIWLGEGRFKTSYGVSHHEPEGTDTRLYGADRGVFDISGGYSVLDSSGFHYDPFPDSGSKGRAPGWGGINTFPLYIVIERGQKGLKYFRDPSRNEHEYQPPHSDKLEVYSVVLDTPAHLSLSKRIEELEKIYDGLTRNNEVDYEIGIRFSLAEIIPQIERKIDELKKDYTLPEEISSQEKLASDFADYLDSEYKEIRLSYRTDIERKGRIREDKSRIKTIINEHNYEEILTLDSFDEFITKRLWSQEIQPDKITDLLGDQISTMKRKQQQAGQELFNVTGNFMRPIYLSLGQEANYIAHCMVKGIDKSKIAPIYDWDGNLLWPTEDNVIQEGRTEVSGQEN